MSKGRALKALVTARLCAAAEDIFALFERTIAEFEEELRRSTELDGKSKRRLVLYQEVPDPAALSPGEDGFGVQMQSPGPALNPETTETPRIKAEPGEQSLKQEEEAESGDVQGGTAAGTRDESGEVSGTAAGTRDVWGTAAGTRAVAESGDALGTAAGTRAGSGKVSGSAEGTRDVWGTAERTRAESGDVWGTAEMTRSESGDMWGRAAGTRAEFGDVWGTAAGTRATSSAALNSAPIPKNKPDTRHEGPGVKKHQCPECKKSFRTKQHLQGHMRVHTGEKPFSCSICKKTFSLKSNLYAHTRIHTQEKPFHCPLCEKRFTQSGALKSHMTTHSWQKPFSCPVCQKGFARKSTRDAHAWTHADLSADQSEERDLLAAE